MTMAQWWIQSGKKETKSEQGQSKIEEEDFKLGGCPGKDVRNPMSAEQEDKVNEISRGKTTDMMIKATYVKLYHQGTKMDWLRMVFSTSTGLKCTLLKLCKYCTGEHMTF